MILLVVLSLTSSSLVRPTAFSTACASSPRVSARMVATSSLADTALADDEEWIQRLDLKSFGAEVRNLGRRLRDGEGTADLRHLRKMQRWNTAFAAVGLATMALPINPVTVISLSSWTYMSWTMLAHHVVHGGYNKQKLPGIDSKRYAVGSPLARVRDWLDWMLPEAWNTEHNKLHHYQLGETGDPDLVERNLEFVRKMSIPRGLKLALVAVLAGVWKWVYYAPNTFKEHRFVQHVQQHGALPESIVEPQKALTLSGVIARPNEFRGVFSRADFFGHCLLPMLVCRFLLLPAPLLLLPGGLGLACFGHAVVHLLLADVVSNYHSFLTIVTNHAGEDLYRFSTPCKPNSDTFLLRQVLSSANYRTGGDVNDCMHGWLNYQVEHHAWPTLSMLSYQKAAPELKAICKAHGVPYVQESVFERLRKTLDIMIGATSMKTWPGHPDEDYPPPAALKRSGLASTAS